MSCADVTPWKGNCGSVGLLPSGALGVAGEGERAAYLDGKVPASAGSVVMATILADARRGVVPREPELARLFPEFVLDPRVRGVPDEVTRLRLL